MVFHTNLHLFYCPYYLFIISVNILLLAVVTMTHASLMVSSYRCFCLWQLADLRSLLFLEWPYPTTVRSPKNRSSWPPWSRVRLNSLTLSTTFLIPCEFLNIHVTLAYYSADLVFCCQITKTTLNIYTPGSMCVGMCFLTIGLTEAVILLGT